MAGVSGSDASRGLFARVFTTHYAKLLRIALSRTGDRALAEEIVQQAFEQAYRSASERLQEETAGGYLWRIVENLCNDQYRARIQESETRVRAERLLSRQAETVRLDVGADHAAGDQLRRALESLAPKMREIVVLRYVADYSEQDAAAILGVAVGTVKSESSKGLKRLRAFLTDDEARSDRDLGIGLREVTG